MTALHGGWLGFRPTAVCRYVNNQSLVAACMSPVLALRLTHTRKRLAQRATKAPSCLEQAAARREFLEGNVVVETVEAEVKANIPIDKRILVCP